MLPLNNIEVSVGSSRDIKKCVPVQIGSQRCEHKLVDGHCSRLITGNISIVGGSVNQYMPVAGIKRSSERQWIIHVGN